MATIYPDAGGTESELEEFIFRVDGDEPTLVMRHDWESNWKLYRFEDVPPDVPIVKAYAPDDWQGRAWQFPPDPNAVIIGWQTARISAKAEWRIKLYVAQYWQIPF